ncbi:hypothetical protein [Acinetobacter courvalinii]|uniref:hypothetical protein n=1 Tax=Acinetobacter courvalinii TaxID=280147 RepID=UPI00289A0D4A|nr:hypothetical protein [Acinetobacter courvalinii]
MNINIEQQVGARFKLIARKANTEEITQESAWFNNLVLDSGLSQMLTGSWSTLCMVGSGNSNPVASQTQLDAIVASTSTAQGANVGGMQTTVEPYYHWIRRTFRFGEGAAAGNLREVGIGWANNACWNRALIRDANGNPTTLTILSDEYLDVVVEVRNYLTRTSTGSFNYLDKLGNVISTHTYTAKSFYSSAGTTLGTCSFMGFSAYSGSITDDISNTITGNIPTGISGTTTIAGTIVAQFKKQSKPVITLTNGIGTLRSFLSRVIGIGVDAAGGGCGYKWQIEPPIVKDNTTELTFTISFTVGRYTGA